MAVVAVVGEVVADAVQVPARDGAERPDRGAAQTTGRAMRLEVHPGGGPANTALALARLGSTARFAGRLSTGALGRHCRSHLEFSGVDLSACIDVAEPATLAITSLGDHGVARYEFYVEGTADWGWTEAELGRLLDPALGPHPAAVHTGSLALARTPPGRLIEDLLAEAAPSATISIDPNLRTGLIPPSTYREAIRRWAGLADIVRLSEDDLSALWPGIGPQDAADRLHAAGASLVVVTLGGAGAFGSLRTAGRAARMRVPAVPVDVVDTVGARDAFQAGLLHYLGEAGLLGGRLPPGCADKLEAALVFASRAAAMTCSRAGADPPWAHELR